MVKFDTFHSLHRTVMRPEGRDLGCHQLSPCKMFGRKTFRMWSLFVRSAGSSLFWKTHARSTWVNKFTLFIIYSLLVNSSFKSDCSTLLGRVGSAWAPSRRRTVRRLPPITAAWRAVEPFWQQKTFRKIYINNALGEMLYVAGVDSIFYLEKAEWRRKLQEFLNDTVLSL